jgi:hypothetical protein
MTNIIIFNLFIVSLMLVLGANIKCDCSFK